MIAGGGVVSETGEVQNEKELKRGKEKL